MNKKVITATAVLSAGILLLLTVVIGFQTKAKGEDDFRINGTILTAYVGTDTFVSVPSTVTTIGEGAFAGNTTLQSIELPDSLREIGYNAFGDCTALISVTIPDSVTKVGPGAFKGCSALTLADLGAGISSWGSGVFNDCTSLSKVIVDEKNNYLLYYNGALYNGDMSMLYQVLAGRTGDSYAMPDEVKEIDTYAFWNQQNIKNVKVSPNVTKIPSYAMSSMGSVENVILPDSVSSIAEKAFANNTALKQVMIPASVNSIQDNAFANSPNVKILTTKNSTADQFGQKQKIPVIYDAEQPTDFNDSNADQEDKPQLKHQTTTVTTTEEKTEQTKEETSKEETSAAQSTQNDENPLDTKEPGVVAKTRIINGKAVVLIGKSNQKVYGGTGSNSSIETSQTQETSEESSSEQETQPTSSKQTVDGDTIKQRAYYKQNNLTNYTISEKIKEIGRLSFAQSGLQSIEIPSNVTTIDYGAFYGCQDLKEVTIPDSVISIGTKAFADTPWLDNWLDGTSKGSEDDFLIVGDHILLAYRGNSAKVEIPEGVKQIGSEAFKDHQELTQITIPDSVSKIGADAFRNCSKLTRVDGGAGLQTIVRGAFYGTQVSEDSLTK
mgnify:FL=1